MVQGKGKGVDIMRRISLVGFTGVACLFLTHATVSVARDIMSVGAALKQSEMLLSTDGRFEVDMQPDCNLVVYKRGASARHRLWATATDNRAQRCELDMQPDGNLVLYDISHRVLWASNTDGHPGAEAGIQSDGNFVVSRRGRALWAAGSDVPEPNARLKIGGDVLGPGEKLASSDSNSRLELRGITLRMQPDCNLVLREGTRAIWASNTDGKSKDCKAILQADGNFVVYGGSGRKVWATDTDGHSYPVLALQIDRNLVLYSGTQHKAIWESHTAYDEQKHFHLFGSKDETPPCPGGHPERTDQSCYGVLICHDIFVCPMVSSTLNREQAGSAYACGVCTPGIKF